MKTIETCATMKKQSYYYGEPKVLDGLCLGYLSNKRPYDTLAACKKCRLWYHYEKTSAKGEE